MANNIHMFLRTILVLCLIPLLYSCASTMSGNTQPVSVSSNVNGARCTLTNEKGSWTLQTPGSAIVTNSRENLAVRCEKNGYESSVVSIPSKHKDSATWGNVVLGGGVGYIWDRKTGAAFIYPSTVNMTLAKKVTSNSPAITLSGDDTVQQLKSLNDLYKSGALTKSEFTKAKKKLLSK